MDGSGADRDGVPSDGAGVSGRRLAGACEDGSGGVRGGPRAGRSGRVREVAVHEPAGQAQLRVDGGRPRAGLVPVHRKERGLLQKQEHQRKNIENEVFEGRSLAETEEPNDAGQSAQQR